MIVQICDGITMYLSEQLFLGRERAVLNTSSFELRLPPLPIFLPPRFIRKWMNFANWRRKICESFDRQIPKMV